jgi:dienelactone hydrolase
MAEILMFHHAHGLTPGVRDYADRLGRAGHTVHTPDLFDGRTFETVAEGITYAQETGFGTVMDRGRAAAERLGPDLVYAGFSLGEMPAQMLAQTRPGARGALLLHSCVPVSEFGGAWPSGVPVQIHAMDDDPFFVGDGDIDAARALVEAVEDGEMYLYPGSGHLFADPGLADYDEAAAEAMTERVLAFLARLP